MCKQTTIVVENSLLSDGGSTPTVSGTCWSRTEKMPTLENSVGHTSNHPDNSGMFKDSLKGLSYNTKYYIRAYATNDAGSSYSQVDSFITLQTRFPAGTAAMGGAVLEVDSTGEHGLIVALPQYITTLAWANEYTKIDGTSADFGTGLPNTQLIVSMLTYPNNTAAQYCQNLVAEGYDDWFLPSYEEMNYFRSNMSFMQWLNYPWNLYWSSSEYSERTAFFVVLGGGADFQDYDKMVALSVLPMRRF